MKTIVKVVLLVGYISLSCSAVYAQAEHETYYYEEMFHTAIPSIDESLYSADIFSHHEYEETAIAQEVLDNEFHHAEVQPYGGESYFQVELPENEVVYSEEAVYPETSVEDQEYYSVWMYSEEEGQNEVSPAIQEIIDRLQEELEQMETCSNLETQAVNIHTECQTTRHSCAELEWSLHLALSDPLSDFSDFLREQQTEAITACYNELRDRTFELRDIWAEYVANDCNAQGQIYLNGINIYDCRVANQ